MKTQDIEILLSKLEEHFEQEVNEYLGALERYALSRASNDLAMASRARLRADEVNWAIEKLKSMALLRTTTTRLAWSGGGGGFSGGGASGGW